RCPARPRPSSALAPPGSSARRKLRWWTRFRRLCTSTGPYGVGSNRSAVSSSSRSISAKARSNSLIAEPARVTEHPELGDVAAEEQRHRPVGDDAQLPRDQRQLVQVVRPRDPPAEEAAEVQAEHLRDALVPAHPR